MDIAHVMVQRAKGFKQEQGKENSLPTLTLLETPASPPKANEVCSFGLMIRQEINT